MLSMITGALEVFCLEVLVTAGGALKFFVLSLITGGSLELFVPSLELFMLSLIAGGSLEFFPLSLE